MKWNEAAVVAAVSALPVRTDGKAPDVAEMVVMIKAGVWSGQWNTARRARQATRKQTLAELKGLCRRCRELYQHIETEMHSPALRLVEKKIAEGREEREGQSKRPLYDPLLLTIQLEGMFAAAREAWREAKSGADLPEPSNRGTKPGAKDVALACADAFEAMTGRPATFTNDDATGESRGPFLNFLKQIFDALGVKASPASMARVAREKTRP